MPEVIRESGIHRMLQILHFGLTCLETCNIACIFIYIIYLVKYL